MVVLIAEVISCREIKDVSDVEPGGFGPQLWAPAWTLEANLGKDLRRQPGTSTGSRRRINHPAALIAAAFS